MLWPAINVGLNFCHNKFQLTTLFILVYLRVVSHGWDALKPFCLICFLWFGLCMLQCVNHLGWFIGRISLFFFSEKELYLYFIDLYDCFHVWLFQTEGEFLIRANTQKRQKVNQDENSLVFEPVEVWQSISAGIVIFSFFLVKK